MPSNTYDELVRTENRHKEKVYGAFDAMRSEASATVASKKKYVDSGAYEDHSSFMAYGSLATAEKHRKTVDVLVQSLYHSPYFAHIDLQGLGNFFLSDCESLDEAITIDGNGMLIPFKRDSQRPISEALHKCYQQKNGAEVTYISPGGKVTCQPKLICDDHIENRTLVSVTPFYPEQEQFHVDADELLDKKLQENRNDPALQNIISTLQREQFRIISADTSVSFIVQGCAGSGKSQCLLHRLFYLREEFSQKGWEHVLLLTPTKLFRHYSANLIRRYRLAQINDCSISELYRTLLNTYDSRFRNRQYQFELSEEYLPDGYLHEIYEPAIIERIDSEISNAIGKYVKAGCDAIGIEVPASIDEKFIESLILSLDAEISKYDVREAVLKRDPEYLDRRAQYEQLQKQLETAQKNLNRAVTDGERIQEDQKEFSDLLANFHDAESEKADWIKQREERINAARNELIRISAEMEKQPAMSAPAHYAHQLCVLRSMTEGNIFAADEEYLEFLNEYCEEAKRTLQVVTKKQKPETYADKLKGKILENSKKQNAFASKADDLSRKVEICAEWLRGKASEMEGNQSQITLHRSELDKSKYFLSRIESTVFESEVWNVLAPIKEKYGIQTIQVDLQEDGHQRETRILYKCDLLFYVKIYAQIHSNKAMPDYQMLCIDEGQDLHKADYDMLHTLFPGAVFNVFGDLAQVLHISCGIEDWEKETGIQQIYKLERNYRNTAAIVDYCNAAFASNMQYIGKVHSKQKPKVFSDAGTLKCAASIPKIVTIVKDNQSFQEFCAAIGKSPSDFEYLDTKVEKPTGEKPACYSIFAAKGLEFSSVLVYSHSMNLNQKVVACTRAMESLCYYE